jgi:prepilin-type N-terminal cleavage/methylation domain-containing protein
MRNEKGFTLIELLVVILIIGILLALIMPNFALFQERARRVSVKDNMHVMQTSIEAYAIDHMGTYPPATDWTDATGIVYYLPGGDIYGWPDALIGNMPINPYNSLRYQFATNILYSSEYTEGDGVFSSSIANGQIAGIDPDCPYLTYFFTMSASDDPTNQGAIVIGTYPDAADCAVNEYGIAGWGRMYTDGDAPPCMHEFRADAGVSGDPSNTDDWIFSVLHD